LELSQDDLASAARVSLSTVRDFEKGRHVPIANNRAAMRAALEAQGIVFVDGGGTCGITYTKPKKGEAH
jgi:DNA-binding transcriptional regulator YiaG